MALAESERARQEAESVATEASHRPRLGRRHDREPAGRARAAPGRRRDRQGRGCRSARPGGSPRHRARARARRGARSGRRGRTGTRRSRGTVGGSRGSFRGGVEQGPGGRCSLPVARSADPGHGEERRQRDRGAEAAPERAGDEGRRRGEPAQRLCWTRVAESEASAKELKVLVSAAEAREAELRERLEVTDRRSGPFAREPG